MPLAVDQEIEFESRLHPRDRMTKQTEHIKELISCLIEHGHTSEKFLDMKQYMIYEYGYKRWAKIIERVIPIVINEKRRYEKDL